MENLEALKSLIEQASLQAKEQGTPMIGAVGPDSQERFVFASFGTPTEIVQLITHLTIRLSEKYALDTKIPEVKYAILAEVSRTLALVGVSELKAEQALDSADSDGKLPN